MPRSCIFRWVVCCTWAGWAAWPCYPRRAAGWGWNPCTPCCAWWCSAGWRSRGCCSSWCCATPILWTLSWCSMLVTRWSISWITLGLHYNFFSKSVSTRHSKWLSDPFLHYMSLKYWRMMQIILYRLSLCVLSASPISLSLINKSSDLSERSCN